jgi:hypothetical protein
MNVFKKTANKAMEKAEKGLKYSEIKGGFSNNDAESFISNYFMVK